MKQYKQKYKRDGITYENNNFRIHLKYNLNENEEMINFHGLYYNFSYRNQNKGLVFLKSKGYYNMGMQYSHWYRKYSDNNKIKYILKYYL